MFTLNTVSSIFTYAASLVSNIDLNTYAVQFVLHYFLGGGSPKSLPSNLLGKAKENAIECLRRRTLMTGFYGTLEVLNDSIDWWTDTLAGVIGSYNIERVEITDSGLICHCIDEFNFNLCYNEVSLPFQVPTFVGKWLSKFLGIEARDNDNVFFFNEEDLSKSKRGKPFTTSWTLFIEKEHFSEQEWELISTNFHPQFLIDWGRIKWRDKNLVAQLFELHGESADSADCNYIVHGTYYKYYQHGLDSFYRLSKEGMTEAFLRIKFHLELNEEFSLLAVIHEAYKEALCSDDDEF